MPRKLVFQNFDASGLPESVFFKFFELRDSPTVHFLQKQLVGASRNLIFPNFYLSGYPEARFFPFFGFSQCRDEPMISFLILDEGADETLTHSRLTFNIAGKVNIVSNSCTTITFSLRAHQKRFGYIG